MLEGTFLRTRIFTHFFRQFICVRLIIRSITKKILNLTWFSLFLDPVDEVEKDLFSILRRNDFILQANWLSVRAERLRANRTSCETTCFHPHNPDSLTTLTILKTLTTLATMTNGKGFPKSASHQNEMALTICSVISLNIVFGEW